MVYVYILIDPNPNGWSGLVHIVPVRIINVHACHLRDACGHGHGTMLAIVIKYELYPDDGSLCRCIILPLQVQNFYARKS